MNYFKIASIAIACILLIFSCSVQSSQNTTDRMPLIIDADTANEVDDLFALARSLAEPGFNLLGITSAQFHISPLATDSTVLESQQMNEDLVRLMNRSDVETPMGSNVPLASSLIPAQSDASAFIIEKAHEMDGEKLHLVILGSCTNVASAIIEDPTIVPKVKVHYLGFWHDTLSNIYDKKEFNSGNDTLAVNVLLNTEGLDMDVMTATTSQYLIFNREQTFAKLNDGTEISQYLKNRWMTYKRWWTAEDPEQFEWVMWDVAIIEALANPKLSSKQSFMTPSENTAREIGIFTHIDVKAMTKDFWYAYQNYLLNEM